MKGFCYVCKNTEFSLQPIIIEGNYGNDYQNTSKTIFICDKCNIMYWSLPKEE